MNSTIMLVDDDATITETLEYNLKRQGFNVTTCSSGKQALVSATQTNSDLIVMDWMLGDLSGPEVVKLIREKGVEAPILMLTGRSSPQDIADGLAAGADDYLAKPFSTIEFMARVQALLRRGKKHLVSSVITVGDLCLDDTAKRFTYCGKEIDLSPKEFHLLKVLMRNKGKTLSTEALLNEVWGYDFSGDAKTVAVHIRWLRQKLEKDSKNPQLLKTIHRSGYRLDLFELTEKEGIMMTTHAMTLVKEDVLALGKLVSSTLTETLLLLQKQTKNDLSLIEEQEKFINQSCLDIEEKCLDLLLADENFGAPQLRALMGSTVIATKLERIADHANRVARIASWANQDQIEIPNELVEMMSAVKGMFDDGLICFLTDDNEKAIEIIQNDHRVDYLHDALSKRLLGDLGDQTTPEAQMRTQFLFCARFLERIGDSCCSIAKRVYFVVTGQRFKQLRGESWQ